MTVFLIASRELKKAHKVMKKMEAKNEAAKESVLVRAWFSHFCSLAWLTVCLFVCVIAIDRGRKKKSRI